jgi:hypothetical protein
MLGPQAAGTDTALHSPSHHAAPRAPAGSAAACLLLVAALLAPAAPARAAAPDYALLDQVLVENVRDGYVDYDGIAANPRFARFLAQLGEAELPAGDRDAELALLVNAYNAFAISGILQGYSPATRVGRHRFFKRAEFRLAGEDVTLDELEHRRLRPLGEPRIHFAIVCASLSCPRLANRAYRPETLDAQLDQAARGFVNDVTRNNFDVAQKTAFLSAIFDWFREDFERAAGSVPKYVERFVEEPATRAALREGRLAVRFLDYDWELNGSFTRPARD